MRFDATLKAASYLAVAAAFSTVALADELAPPFIAVFVVLALASWWWEEPRVRTGRFELAFNVVTLLCLLGTPLRYRQNGSLAHTFIELLTILALNRLFNRRSARDYLLLYVISFGLLLGATVLNTDLVFAPCFIVYVVAITWSLALSSIRRQIEESTLVRHEADASTPVDAERLLRSRRIVSGRFLLGTGALSIAMLVCSSITFFLFPRIGLGLMGLKQNRGHQMAGFSERVELGQHGTIKDNPDVIMRVELDAPPSDQLRFRGISFDTYDEGRWSRSPEARRVLARAERGTKQLVAQRVHRQETKLLKHTVFLTPMGTRAVFAATTPVMAGWGELQGGRGIDGVERLTDGDLVRSDDGSRPARYLAFSDPDEPRDRDQATVLPDGWEQPREHETDAEYARRFRTQKRVEEYQDALHERLLQIPDHLRPKLEEIVGRIVRPDQRPAQKVSAIEQYLKKGFHYTTEMPPVPAGVDPVVHFLEVARRGHCEYFATAGTLLLRAAGVPALEVNGFHGGAWNPMGGFLAVRQSDAHAWTEAWLPGQGFVTLDFTPAQGRGARRGNGFGDGLREIVDVLEMKWFKWVVDYDMRRQLDLAFGIKRALSFGGPGGKRPGGKGLDVRGLLRPAAIAGALLGVGFVVWRLRRRGGGGPARRRHGPEDRLLELALRRLERKGVMRGAAQTPLELARALRATDPAEAELLERVTAVYYASRFGEVAAQREVLDSLRRDLARS